MNPRTPTTIPTHEEVGKIVGLLFRIEAMLGNVAEWIEVLQVRFEQNEAATGWTANITAILKEPGSERKISPNWYVEQNLLESERGLLDAVEKARYFIGNDLQMEKYGFEKVAKKYGDALAAIKPS